LPSDFPRFDFTKYPQLTFEQPDTSTFRCLGLAFEAMERGGNMPCIMNAANEIAVAKFLNDEIGFLEIPDMIEKAMNTIDFVATPTLDDYIATDFAARECAVAL
jgi:1-deoxy-D-xylulose-5-phosphate reductoisomerase